MGKSELGSAASSLPVCGTVFIAFLIWLPGRMGLAGMKNKEVREGREFGWQVEFCADQIMVDLSRS